MANYINEAEKEAADKISTIVSNMTKEERERFLWIGEGIIFAKQIRNNEQ